MTHFWGKYITDYFILTSIRLLFPIRSYLLLECFGVLHSSSLLLRVRFSGFTNVFSLAVEYLVSLLGGVVFATLVGLGTSSFG
jgi:hypothetical protein